MSDNNQALAIIPRTVDEVATLARLIAESSTLPDALRGKEPETIMAIIAGAELGMPPMAALRSVNVIKGKPVLSADAMIACVRGRGIAKYFSCVDESDTSVTYESHRVGDPAPQRMTWTMEDAKRAQLSGDNWRKYPRAMLKARCKAALARDLYPDVLAGCYTPDEAQSFGGGAVDAEFVEVKTEARQVADAVEAVHAQNEDPSIEAGAGDNLDDEISIAMMAIQEAESVFDLKKLATGIKKMDARVQDAVRGAYKARLEQVRA